MPLTDVSLTYLTAFVNCFFTVAQDFREIMQKALCGYRAGETIRLRRPAG